MLVYTKTHYYRSGQAVILCVRQLVIYKSISLSVCLSLYLFNYLIERNKRRSSLLESMLASLSCMQHN